MVINKTTWRMIAFACVLAVQGLWAAAPALAQTAIDTLSHPSLNANNTSLGEGQILVRYGQTFTVGSDHYLQSFTFAARSAGPNLSRLVLRIQAWQDGPVPNTSDTTGPVLFQSGEINPPAESRTNLTINTNNLNLAAGGRYVAYWDISQFADGLPDQFQTTSTGEDIYSGGNVVVQIHGTDYWLDEGNGGDMGFRAEFTSNAVPEPASMVLMLAAALACGVPAALRKRRRDAGTPVS